MSLIHQWLNQSETSDPTLPSQKTLQQDLQPWLCLAFTPGIGPKTFQSILNHGYAPSDIFQLHKTDLKALGLSAKSIEYLNKYTISSPHGDVEKALAWQQSNPARHIIHWSHADYPEKLKHINSPPPVLMVQGQLNCLQQPQVAIVGSRHPTATGKTQAQEFAGGLADAGFVITSGLAKGVDGAAHKGALKANGATIAVLGTGFNCIYPKQHAELANEICEKGALVSEFPLDTKPFQGNFPRRNRIVSGLCLGTLVIEAALKSGSLITARQALEQNREVFAIPGSISNPQKTGCHHLIRQGAILVEHPEHILQELAAQLDYKQAITKGKNIPKAAKQYETNNRDERLLLNALDYDGVSVDELVVRSGLTVSHVTPLLMMMELKGWVCHEEGKYKLQ